MSTLRAKKWIKNWEELVEYTESFRLSSFCDVVYYDTPMWDRGYLSDWEGTRADFADEFNIDTDAMTYMHLYVSDDRCLLRMYLKTNKCKYSEKLLLDYDFNGRVVDCVELRERTVKFAVRLTLRGAMKVLCDEWFSNMEMWYVKAENMHVVNDGYTLSVLLKYMDYDLGRDLGACVRPVLSFNDKLDDADIVELFCRGACVCAR